MKKAQASVEMIVILAVVLVIFGILFVVIQENYSAYERNLKTVQGKTALREFADAADFVYSQGEGAKTKIFVTIPQGVESIEGGDNYIEMRLDLGGRIQDLIEGTETCVQGEIPTSAGGHWVLVEYAGGCIRMGGAELQCLTVSPESVGASIYSEDSYSTSLTISNSGNSTTNVSVEVPSEYTISGWVTITPSSLTIAESGSDSTTVNISIPQNTQPGLYYGRIKVEGCDTLWVDVSVLVLSNQTPDLRCPFNETAVRPGQSWAYTYMVCNTGEASLIGMTISGEGSGNWIVFDGGGSVGDVSPGSCVYKDSQFNIPISTTDGLYTGSVTVSNGDSWDTCNFTVNVSLTITTAEQYCISLGYDTGVCVESPSQCTADGHHHEGEGDVYCTGGSSEDTACCEYSLTCNAYCAILNYGPGTCRENAGQCSGNGETHKGLGDIYCVGGPSADSCCCAPLTTSTTTTSTTSTSTTVVTTSTTTVPANITACSANSASIFQGQNVLFNLSYTAGTYGIDEGWFLANSSRFNASSNDSSNFWGSFNTSSLLGNYTLYCRLNDSTGYQVNYTDATFVVYTTSTTSTTTTSTTTTSTTTTTIAPAITACSANSSSMLQGQSVLFNLNYTAGTYDMDAGWFLANSTSFTATSNNSASFWGSFSTSGLLGNYTLYCRANDTNSYQANYTDATFVVYTTTTTTTTSTTSTTTTLATCQQACSGAGYGQWQCRASCGGSYSTPATAGDAWCLSEQSKSSCCCR